MDLTGVINLSSGAVVLRRIKNSIILFVQIPGLSKAKIVAAKLGKEDCELLAKQLETPEGIDDQGWNRIAVTVATAADLTGT